MISKNTKDTLGLLGIFFVIFLVFAIIVSHLVNVYMTSKYCRQPFNDFWSIKHDLDTVTDLLLDHFEETSNEYEALQYAGVRSYSQQELEMSLYDENGKIAVLTKPLDDETAECLSNVYSAFGRIGGEFTFSIIVYEDRVYFQSAMTPDLVYSRNGRPKRRGEGTVFHVNHIAFTFCWYEVIETEK